MSNENTVGKSFDKEMLKRLIEYNNQLKESYEKLSNGYDSIHPDDEYELMVNDLAHQGREKAAAAWLQKEIAKLLEDFS